MAPPSLLGKCSGFDDKQQLVRQMIAATEKRIIDNLHIVLLKYALVAPLATVADVEEQLTNGILSIDAAKRQGGQDLATSLGAAEDSVRRADDLARRLVHEKLTVQTQMELVEGFVNVIADAMGKAEEIEEDDLNFSKTAVCIALSRRALTDALAACHPGPGLRTAFDNDTKWRVDALDLLIPVLKNIQPQLASIDPSFSRWYSLGEATDLSNAYITNRNWFTAMEVWAAVNKVIASAPATQSQFTASAYFEIKTIWPEPAIPDRQGMIGTLKQIWV